MNHPAAAADPLARRQSARMSRREWLGWFVAAFFVVECARVVAFASASAVAATNAPFNAIRLIAWGCAALLLARAHASRPAGPGMVPLLFAGLAALLLPLDETLSGLLGSLVLALVGAATLGAGWSEAERGAGRVMLAIAVQGLLTRWAVVLFERPILWLDTALAGLAMQVVTPGSAWGDFTVRPPGGVGVTLYLACSSFANLSLVWLCFVALATLDGIAWTRRAWLVAGGISAFVIVVNTARIVAMAQSLTMYAYWHTGPGGRGLALALSAATVALCSLGARWAGTPLERRA